VKNPEEWLQPSDARAQTDTMLLEVKDIDKISDKNTSYVLKTKFHVEQPEPS